MFLHHYFGIQESQIAFDIFLHLATGLVVLVYFYPDIASLFTTQRALAILILAGCVPTFILGFLFADKVERFFVNIKLVGAALVINGIWLFAGHFVDKMGSRLKNKGPRLHVWQAFVIGAAQGIALIPGISRSGATIATGLLCGLGSNLAFRFSFLLLLPATAGAAIFKLKNATTAMPEILPLLVGSFFSFAVGLIALNMLSKALKKGLLHFFSIYCILIGLLAIFLK